MSQPDAFTRARLVPRLRLSGRAVASGSQRQSSGFSVGLAALGAVALAAIALVEPFGAAALGLVAPLGIWLLLDPGSFVVVLLTAKPLIDLSWSGPSIGVEGATRGLNAQGAVAIAAACLLTAHVALRDRPRLARPLMWQGGFAALCLVSLAIGRHNAEALRGFTRVASAFPFLVVGRYVLTNETRVRRFLLTFLLVLTVPYTLSLLQAGGLLRSDATTFVGAREYSRVTGGYIHPLAFYKILFIALPLILVVWPSAQRTRLRLFLAAHFVLTFLFTALTILRMGLVTGVTQCLLWLWSKRRWAMLTLLVAGVLVGVAVSDIPRKVVGDQLARLEEAGGGLDYRVGIWRGYLDYYLEEDALQQLFGAGFYVDATRQQTRYYAAGGSPDDAHNDFVRILVENGACGLLLYLGFLHSLWSCARRWERRATGFWREYALGARILLVSFVMMSVTINASEEVTCAWYLLAVFSPLVLPSPTESDARLCVRPRRDRSGGTAGRVRDTRRQRRAECASYTY